MGQKGIWGLAAGAFGLILLLAIGAGALVGFVLRGPRTALAAGAGLFQSAPAQNSQSSSGPKPTPTVLNEIHSKELAADTLFAHASPSVVRIVTRDEDFQVTGFGSGFFISDDGQIVTNYHVIRGAVFATVVTSDNSTLFVEGLLASDPKADLALLKVFGAGYPALPVGDTVPPRIGTKVFAIGNPEGLTNTLSEGLISGVRDWRKGVTAIQTTAPISHGSSGGPLIAADGTVVGVTAASRIDGQSLNFAIAAADVRKLIDSQGELHGLASAGMPALTPAQTKAFDAVWAALDKRQFAEMERCLDDLRPEHDSDPIYWLARGLLENARNHESAAVSAFGNALSLNPGFQPGWVCLAAAYAKYKHFDEAIDSLEHARKLNPDSPTCWDLEGLVYSISGRTQRALAAFQAALKVAPNDVLGLAGAGHAYCLLKQYPQAVASCRRSIALRPDFAEPYLDLGVAYNHMGRYPDASACWQTAARLDPKGATGRRARSLLLNPGGDGLTDDSQLDEAGRQHRAALDAVSHLQLQSIGANGTMMRCQINGVVHNEGDNVEGFTIEKIRPTGVIVRRGAYRFQLTQRVKAPGAASGS